VGALRPLKFCRHLPALGWEPVVLCDLHESDAIDVTLSEALPAEVTVVRDWSRTARRNEAAVARGTACSPLTLAYTPARWVACTLAARAWLRCPPRAAASARRRLVLSTSSAVAETSMVSG
jgi:hypothetical protein